MEIKEALVKNEACTEQLSSASCAVASEAMTVTKDCPSYQETKQIFANSSSCANKSETVVTSVETISNWRTEPMAIPLRKPTMVSTSAKSWIAAGPYQRYSMLCYDIIMYICSIAYTIMNSKSIDILNIIYIYYIIEY